ncbi:hypothetical protein CMI47_13280 [Candidatus Pacearchaeota archaeon]|nr:hypothetical protein [Candidatus Pacearchaeota archaeon]
MNLANEAKNHRAELCEFTAFGFGIIAATLGIASAVNLKGLIVTLIAPEFLAIKHLLKLIAQ